jgi:hypothetical protein
MKKRRIALALKNNLKEEAYADLVNSFIRRRYSLSAELAILRQRDEKTEEFSAFNAYAEECKTEARKIIKEVEEHEA